MTNPGPLSGDERPLAGPDGDPFAVGEVPPAAVPPAPAYEPSELLQPTPAYDALAEEAGLDERTDTMGTTPASTGVGPDADYALAPNPGESGPLGVVKTFAAQKPAVFIGVALAIGWVLGKIFSSSSDDDES